MILEKFAEQVKRFPDKIAVKAGDKFLTYHELDEYADRIAEEIISFDHQGEADTAPRAALLFEHGIEMLVGVIGVLKADRIYVPFDVSYPIKRLAYMLENSGSLLILTNRLNLPLAGKLTEEAKHKVEILNIENISHSNHGIRQPKRLRKADGDKPAYILYTSGSTGWPKGVVQTHRGVLYFVRNWVERFSITTADHMTLLPAFSHDAAVMDIFVALLSGVCLYPYSTKIDPDGHGLYNLLKKEKITIWHSVPSLFRYFGGTLPGAEHFDKIRWVLLGGEPVRSQDLELHKTFFPKAALGIIYGQTESSVNNICIISRENTFNDVSIGEPLDETEIFLVDKDGDLIEDLGAGEIVVASDYIARGYWQDEEKSNAVFINDDEGRRLYLTGDMGRYTGRGIIKIMGRKDFQVKIRGFRVETGEIESVLLHHEAVREAVTVVKQDESGDNYLSTYFVTNRIIPAEELRAHLSRELPAYMIPRFFIPLEKIPLTPNGKIDRQHLPEPEEVIPSESVYVAPSNEIEEKLAAIWQEVLAVERVGIYDNFIELGGHSLMVMSIISKIYQEFNVELRLGDVFEHPIIKELAQLIAASTPSIFTTIAPVEKKAYYRLSSAQKRLYILQEMDRHSTAYNLPAFIPVFLSGGREKFEETIKHLVLRHESFRTSFHVVENEVVQRVHSGAEFKIEYYELRNSGRATPPGQEKERKEISDIIKSFVKPFDLSQAPLVRVGLITLNQNNHLFMVDCHHIISDGTSQKIVERDFMLLYHGHQLPGLPLQYRDFSEWCNSGKQQERIKSQEAYWLKRFEDEIPVLELRTDYARPGQRSFAGAKISVAIESEITRQLKHIVLQEEATLFMVLLAALNVLLARYTTQEDIIIGSVTAGRGHPGLEDIVGFLLNTLAIRNYPNGHKSFKKFLQEVKINSLKAFENQDYPFQNLIEKLVLERPTNRNPLFDVMFILENVEKNSLVGLEKENITSEFISFGYENKTSKFDLSVYCWEEDEKLLLTFEYCTALFKDKTIQRMIKDYTTILELISRKLDIEIKDIPLENNVKTLKKAVLDVSFNI